MKLFSESILVE